MPQPNKFVLFKKLKSKILLNIEYTKGLNINIVNNAEREFLEYEKRNIKIKIGKLNSIKNDVVTNNVGSKKIGLKILYTGDLINK